MTPQQNSTLVEAGLEAAASFTNIVEVISHYSPIMPLKNKKQSDPKIICNSKKPEMFTHDRNALNQHKICQQKRHNHGCRSISLSGSNSTMDQGHKEITIWLCGEPRYIYGVTNKTTCQDIIKALIDDEVNTNKKCELYSCKKDKLASRDYSAYVITECWRGIERSYDNNMTILPIWKAWNRVHNEIRLNLKLREEVKDPTKLFLQSNAVKTSLRKLFNKWFRFGHTSEQKHQTKAKLHAKHKHRERCPTVNGCKKTAEKTKTVTVQQPTQSHAETINKWQRTDKHSSTRRLRRYGSNKTYKTRNGRPIIDRDHNNFMPKRKSTSNRNSIRRKLAQKNYEMNKLYEREYALTRTLTNKCKIYKLQNDFYTNCDKNFEISVGQIQHNIEACAEEIIQTEHELLEIKNEIKHDISLINTLKRLTLEKNPKASNTTSHAEAKPIIEYTQPKAEQIDFVDNIYEFCDNNASLLV